MNLWPTIGLLYLVYGGLQLTFANKVQKCSNKKPCTSFKGGNKLVLPQQLFSKDGQLDVVLNVDVSEVQFDWFITKRRLFNDSLLGPTLHVKSGDTINLILVNNLQDNVNIKRRLINITSVYFQGLHVSPKENDVLSTVKPGMTRNISFEIPCNHPAGTYIYQPTHQGSLTQVLSGMSGLLLIHDNPVRPDIPQELKDVSCPLHCENDMQMVFQPTLMYNRALGASSFGLLQQGMKDEFRNLEPVTGWESLEDWLIHPDNAVQYFTINGVLKPIMQIYSKQLKRFRLANAGAVHTLEIMVPTSTAGRTCDVKEIAVDGVYLEKPRKILQQTLLLPGGRVDWLIKCDTPDAYVIESRSMGRNIPSLASRNRFTGVLGTLNVIQSTDQEVTVSKFPETLPFRPPMLADLRDVSDYEIAAKFVVEVSRNNLLNRESFSKIVRHKMALGGVQEWTLLNPSKSRMVPLHIPLNHFQIIKYNAYKGPAMVHYSNGEQYFVDQNRKKCAHQFYSDKRKKSVNLRVITPIYVPHLTFAPHQRTPSYNLGFVSAGEWRSVVPLPPLCNITIRFVPKRFTGPVPIFSHNFVQKDQGMVLLTQAVEKGESVEVVVEEGDHPDYPGTCNSGDWYPPKIFSPTTPQTTATTTTTTAGNKITAQTLEKFFLWLYKYYAQYKSKYGNQKYLSVLYDAFLRQSNVVYQDGNHLSTFFDWLYAQFPTYQTYYGDQKYLTELYVYFLKHNFQNDF